MVFPGQDSVQGIDQQIFDHPIPPEVGHHGHMLGGFKALVPGWQGAIHCANHQV